HWEITQQHTKTRKKNNRIYQKKKPGKIKKTLTKKTPIKKKNTLNTKKHTKIDTEQPPTSQKKKVKHRSIKKNRKTHKQKTKKK
ncbi:hypothetical protein LW976_17790, partial [Erwinia amylovora]|uniref:hypothetical protein n=1 Tax=Erwinia amylovora TaxID=552 RepID=UPI0020C12510